MNIEFDKRLELIYGILYCVNKDMNNTLHPGLFAEEMPSYCNEFYKLYKKVGITDEFMKLIINRGISSSWAAPAIIALSLDENYNIIENECLFEMVETYSPYYDKEKIERCLKEFVEKSNFEDFYKEHSDFYSNIVKEYKKAMSEFNIFDENVIEDFYGYKLGEMSIKLYNFTTGSSGLLIGNNQYYNQRVHNIGKDENNFIFKPKLGVLFHEFSHPYINPLVEKYFSNVNCYDLYQEIIENDINSIISTTYQILDSKNAYTILAEYIVRAVTIYLESKYEKKEVINEKIKVQYDYGFIHIENLIKLFDKKNEYNSFEDFFKNEIVDYILNLKCNIRSKKNSKK